MANLGPDWTQQLEWEMNNVRTSESIREIAPALVKAQAAIEAVVKNKTGKIVAKEGKSGYEYKYSDLASVIDHVKGPLNENGIAFLQTLGAGQTGIQVTTRLLHQSGEWIEDDTPVPCPYATAQAFGSAYTYGKRYGLQAMVGLPSEDDDGKKATDDNGLSPRTDELRDNGFGGKKPITATQEAHDAFSELSDEAKDYVNSHAKAILGIFAVKGDMHAYAEKQGFDNETKLALWSCLPSNVRSEFKRQQIAHRMAEQA